MKRIAKNFLFFSLIFSFDLVHAVSDFYPPSSLLLMNNAKNQEYKEVDMNNASSLLKLYERTKEANKYANGVMSSVGSVANTAIDVADLGGSLIGGTLGGLPGLISAKLLTNASKGVVNSVVKSIEDHGEHMSKQYLIGAIDKTYQRVPNLKTLSIEEQYKEIMKTRKLEDQISGKVIENHEHNAIFQTFMIRALRSEVVELAIENAGSHQKSQHYLNAIAKEQLKIEDLMNKNKNEIMNKIETIGHSLIELEKRRCQDQLDIMKTQVAMVSSVNTLTLEIINQHQEISQTNSNVKTVKEILFSKMTLAEQQKRLKDGVMNDVFTENQKKALESRINFEITIGNVFETGQHAIQIARNLGINSPVINDIAKGMAAVQAGVGLAMAISTSNPMGIISNVANLTGIFGKTQDPAAERHSEIMKGFQALSEQIAEGNKAVLEELQTIQKMLSLINHKIDEINNKLDAVNTNLQHIKLLLYNIDQNIVDLSDLVKAGVYKDYLACENKLIAPLMKIKSYQTLEAFLNPVNYLVISDRMKQCIEGFDLIFSQDKQSEFFKTFTAYNKSPSHNLKLNYQLLLGLLGKDLEKISLSRLVVPNDNYSMLYAKNNVEDRKLVSFNWSSMINLLDSRLVVKVVEDYLAFYPITYMFTRNCQYPQYCKFLSFEEMNKRQEVLFPGSTMDNLRNALTLVQIAIAQQTLLSGDIALYPILDKLKEKPDKIYLAQLERLFSFNPMLAKNFLILYIKDWIESNNPRSDWYPVALRSPQMRQLIDALKLPFDLKFESNNGVNSVYFQVLREHEKIDRESFVNIYLPSVEEVREGTLKLSPELIKLLKLREKLIGAITDIRIMEKMRESKDEQLKRSYLELVY